MLALWAHVCEEHLMVYSILTVLHVILFIIAAYEIVTSRQDPVKKVLWLLLILLLPLVGLIIYYLLGRGK